MSEVQWKPEYELGVVTMDDTHREFIDLLNRLADCPPAEALERFDALLDHTVAHFWQEDVWMDKSDFPPLYCHRGEHERVLDVLREVRRLIAAGDDGIVVTLLRELPLWFDNHAATMDAALAGHIERTGFAAERINAEAAPA